MKRFHKRAMLKMTVMAMLLTFIGFQQAQAQLTVVNNSSCWIVVGEKEGPNCQECNNSQGTWIAPFGGTETFQSVCPASGFPDAITPTPPGFQSWIGIKYAASDVGPTNNPGPAGYTPNPFYLPGPCGSPTPGICGGAPMLPITWFQNGVNGSMFVLFQ